MLPRLTSCSILLALVVGCVVSPEENEGADRGTEAQSGGVCPTEEPAAGIACEGTFACAYPACGRLNGSVWSCELSAWKQIIIPGCEPGP